MISDLNLMCDKSVEVLEELMKEKDDKDKLVIQF